MLPSTPVRTKSERHPRDIWVAAKRFEDIKYFASCLEKTTSTHARFRAINVWSDGDISPGLSCCGTKSASSSLMLLQSIVTGSS